MYIGKIGYKNEIKNSGTTFFLCHNPNRYDNTINVFGNQFSE